MANLLYLIGQLSLFFFLPHTIHFIGTIGEGGIVVVVVLVVLVTVGWWESAAAAAAAIQSENHKGNNSCSSVPTGDGDLADDGKLCFYLDSVCRLWRCVADSRNIHQREREGKIVLIHFLCLLFLVSAFAFAAFIFFFSSLHCFSFIHLCTRNLSSQTDEMRQNVDH